MNTTTTSSNTGEDGFVILDHKPKVKPVPEPAALPPEPPRQFSDEMLSANVHYNWGTHVAYPIYKDGTATGEWRVCRLRSRFDIPGKTIPWEAVLPNKDAAMDWGRSMTEQMRQAKHPSQ